MWNVIRLHDGKITDILPDNIKTDPLVEAVGYAVSNAMKSMLGYARKAGVYAAVDLLDGEAVDLLAAELRTKYYGPWLDLDEKRQMVKKTLPWYYRAGTLSTVKELTDFVFKDAQVEEWFQYASDPYLFRLLVEVTDQDISMEKYTEFLKSLRGVKNTRSHLEAVVFRHHADVTVRTVAAGGIGNTVKVKARLAERVEAETEDRQAAAVIYEDAVHLRARDEITDADVYIEGENGGKIRVLTENGSVVRVQGWNKGAET